MADLSLQRKARSGTPWQAIFTAWLNGAPEEELAQIYDVKLTTLQAKIREEEWEKLRTRLPLAPIPEGRTVEAKLEKLLANREQNFQGWAQLRDHAMEEIKALREGRLELEKVFNNPKSGTVTRAKVKPGPADWVNIAGYLQKIAEGTYRALGDIQATEKGGQDGPVGSVSAPLQPAITIILPREIAAPRAERAIENAKADPNKTLLEGPAFGQSQTVIDLSPCGAIDMQAIEVTKPTDKGKTSP